MKPELNMSWGEPVVVRQALVEILGRKFSLASKPLDEMGYPPHFGTLKLIKQLKDIAQRQSGHRPKHLFITCGASGAIHASLYALKTANTDFVVTDSRYYPFYPSIISMSDMNMIDRNKKSDYLKMSLSERRFLSLVASPSNPEGFVYPFESVDVWDAAYASKTYTNDGHVPNKFKVMCGSVSKTLGLPGLRLGWVSTDLDDVADSLGSYVTAAYIGLSTVSMGIAEEVLGSLDQDRFETLSRGYLDDNRQEMQKVLNKFGQGNVSSRGMFAVLELGKSERKALERAKVKWLPGSVWGETDDWARLSLGQTREIVRSAVKAILK